MSDEVKRKVDSLFGNGFTPSQAYNRFLMNSKNNYDNELNFQEHFGRGNDPEMFSNLEQRN